ncbi:TPA: ribosome silencing factor [Staphylococcus pseudintermedius]|uniref:ribosome silencing factor n=1 Tax=Staphylococcus pseudintermedius TaxID=283734 RepID=UPI0018F3C706|nr:ribosome silencing factor [Staphylococcus pseudintermedius]EGQ1779958.1 ribosome silencing factor [Staphylococcus pseudintermedius]EGQ2886031.1 ribosome silencing factor [Staphylococcus pseudintermedius]EGQ3279720.1 ribosome silencing factor [Staphylococcus pseudintermedius]EGQ3460530.1 ribosome silencing factor [Staphylococcus pseudintermedius]EGQ3609410.1 ribosome silencing factor [Staphylococcus pseudintermedius]
MNAKDLLMLTVEAADAKKAEEIISLNMSGVSDLTDYFVVCHGNNERQVQAIARAVKESAESHQIEVKRMEGFNEARWILVDLTDVVVHIFHKDERSYYNLEKLYQDVEMLGYKEVINS